MRTNRTRRLIAIVVTLLVVAAPTIWLARQYRRQVLNRDLISAIKRSDAAGVASLLSSGADPNTRDTPVKHGSLWETLRDLVHPPPPDLSPTALVVAISVQRQADFGSAQPPVIVKILLSKGANVNAPQELGSDPLLMYFSMRFVVNNSGIRSMGSAARENPELLKALISAGANLEVADRDGDTPLTISIGSGVTECARLLLEGGANPNRAGYRGLSPLAIAREYNRTAIEKLLLAHGAK